MNNSISKIITDKWKVILQEYELVKKNRSKHFSTVEALCEAYKVSRKQICKYYGRWVFSGQNPESLLPQKRGPRLGQGRMLNKEQERILIKIQRRFEAKPLDVWALVRGVFEVHPSVRTVARILARYPQRQPKKIIHRYEKKAPGELIHGDTFNLPKKLFTDGKQRYLKGMIDDCTRLNYVECIERKGAKEAGLAFLRAGKWFYLHGFVIEKYISDNGSEYTATVGSKSDHIFEEMLKLYNIAHLYTKPYRPQTNGKIERFWRTIKEEFLPGLSGLTLAEFNAKLKQFMYFYNYQRPHAGIKYKTPFEKLQFVTETLA